MRPLIYLFLLASLAISCVELDNNLESDWSSSMRGLAGSYNKMTPFLYGDKIFESSQNREKISELIQQIVEDSNNLQPQHQKQMLGTDPLFKMALAELKNTSLEAQDAFVNKKYNNSKYLLKNSVMFCVQCHTHSNRGPEILQWDNFASLAKIHPIEQSKVYIATRQYSKAEKIISQYLASSPPPSDAKIIKALKLYINLAAKQKNDPKIALDKIELLQNSQYYSLLLQKTRFTIESWKSYLKSWASNLKKGELPNINVLVSSHDSGRFLDDKGYVTAIRNSLIYHDKIRKGPRYDHKPIIYHKLGIIYDRYPEMGTWGLPETYFQACIYVRPHSKIAKKCFRDLEKRIRSIYRFDGDASIPLRAKQRLNHYKSLSINGPKPGAPRTNFYNN